MVQNSLQQANTQISSREDDELLIAAAQNGSVRSFEQLYRQNYKRIYLFAKRMTNSTSDAEDIVQDTFVKAWQKLDSFKGQSLFHTWLRTIASRVSIDRLRVKNALVWRQSSEYQDIYPNGASKVDAIYDLEKMIRLLPDGARSIFVLHDIEGFKHQEISEMIGIAVGTSKAQLHRARKLLRESMSP